MSFTAKINDAIKQAMLAKEKERLAALRDIKSKLLLEATSGAGGEVNFTNNAWRPMSFIVHKEDKI